MYLLSTGEVAIGRSASAVFAALLCDTMLFLNKTFPSLVFMPAMPTEVQIIVYSTLLGSVQVVISWAKRECDATFIA